MKRILSTVAVAGMPLAFVVAFGLAYLDCVQRGDGEKGANDGERDGGVKLCLGKSENERV